MERADAAGPGREGAQAHGGEPSALGGRADHGQAARESAAPEAREDTSSRRPARGFRGWRRRRPFWGGLLVLLGGAEILLSEQASVSVVLKAGAESLAGYVLPVVMVVCGLLILFNPLHRLFYSVIAVLCSLATWITSNLGGFVIGMLLGVVGSCLAFGWLPNQEPRRWRRSERRAARAARAEARERARAPGRAEARGAAEAGTPG